MYNKYDFGNKLDVCVSLGTVCARKLSDLLLKLLFKFATRSTMNKVVMVHNPNQLQQAITIGNLTGKILLATVQQSREKVYFLIVKQHQYLPREDALISSRRSMKKL